MGMNVVCMYYGPEKFVPHDLQKVVQANVSGKEFLWLFSYGQR
jgi:hypothetical protein